MTDMTVSMGVAPSGEQMQRPEPHPFPVRSRWGRVTPLGRVTLTERPMRYEVDGVLPPIEPEVARWIGERVSVLYQTVTAHFRSPAEDLTPVTE